MPIIFLCYNSMPPLPPFVREKQPAPIWRLISAFGCQVQAKAPEAPLHLARTAGDEGCSALSAVLVWWHPCFAPTCGSSFVMQEAASFQQ